MAEDRKRGRRESRGRARRKLHHGSYEPPPRDDCEEIPWSYPGDADNTIQVIRRVWLQRGALTEFVAAIKVLTADGWMEIERIDCRHGHCHLHDRNGAVIHLDRLDTADDVLRAHSKIDRVIDERLRILESREDR